MRDGEVEFYPKGGPGTAVPNLCLLDRWVGVKEWLSADFVNARIKMTTKIREHSAFQVLVFEKTARQLCIDFAPVRLSLRV